MRRAAPGGAVGSSVSACEDSGMRRVGYQDANVGVGKFRKAIS